MSLPVNKMKNVVSYTHGAARIYGIKEIQYVVDPGVFRALVVEGNAYPTAYELLGRQDVFPVTGRMIFETGHDTALTAALLAMADGVAVLKAITGGTNVSRTFKNLKFGKQEGAQKLEEIALPSMDFFCTSVDGSTLPIIDA